MASFAHSVEVARPPADVFPWLLEEASPEQVKAVLAGLPAPLRVVYRRIWQPRYARHDHWKPSTQGMRMANP